MTEDSKNKKGQIFFYLKDKLRSNTVMSISESLKIYKSNKLFSFKQKLIYRAIWDYKKSRGAIEWEDRVRKKDLMQSTLL